MSSSDSDTDTDSSLEIIPTPIRLESPLAKSLLLTSCILEGEPLAVQQYVTAVGIRTETPHCKQNTYFRQLKLNFKLFLYENQIVLTSFFYGVGLSLLFSTIMYERYINSLYREKYK